MGDLAQAVELVSFDLESIVEDIVRGHADAAGPSAPELCLRYVPGTPRQITSDPVNTRQTVGHLLHHMAQGERVTRVQVEVTGEPGPPPRIHLTVRAMDGQAPADSMYLRVVHELAQDLGVSVTQEAGQIRITFEQPEYRPVPVAQDQPYPVLLADSRAWVRELLGEQLQAFGCQVSECETADQLLEALPSSPSLAVVGADLLCDPRLAETPGFRELPKLAILAYLKFLDVPRRSKLGIGGSIHCPVMPSHVRRAVLPLLPDRTGPRVLVVEDALLNTLVATHILARLGYHVDTAEDGVKAVELATRTDYRLILMDCQLPQMDGFEATRQIRKRRGDASPPIVAVTALAMTGDREKCLAAGMDDYLAKPYGAQQLTAMIERWIQVDC